jgi:hypothetical protein
MGAAMSSNDLNIAQFRQVVSVLTTINLFSDYIGEEVRPRWYFEHSELDDSQRAALTELVNDSPIMPMLDPTRDKASGPLMVNLADPTGYMPRESGLIHCSSEGVLTLSIGNPAEFMDAQQISSFNAFIRRLKNRSEIVCAGGSAFESVTIKFEQSDDVFKNAVAEFKNDKGEALFVVDGYVANLVEANLPDNFARELNEFVAHTMMISTEDMTFFEELLGAPIAKSELEPPAPVIQETHPQWGTW